MNTERNTEKKRNNKAKKQLEPEKGFDTMRAAFEENEKGHTMDKITKTDWKEKITFVGVAQVAALAVGGYFVWRNRSRLMSAIKSSTDYVSPYLEKVTGKMTDGKKPTAKSQEQSHHVN